MSVSLLGGLRTEEARALRWSDVDLEAGTVTVVRSVRLSGETKTKESRRAVQLFCGRRGSAEGARAEAGALHRNR